MKEFSAPNRARLRAVQDRCDDAFHVTLDLLQQVPIELQERDVKLLLLNRQLTIAQAIVSTILDETYPLQVVREIEKTSAALARKTRYEGTSRAGGG